MNDPVTIQAIAKYTRFVRKYSRAIWWVGSENSIPNPDTIKMSVFDAEDPTSPQLQFTMCSQCGNYKYNYDYPKNIVCYC